VQNPYILRIFSIVLFFVTINLGMAFAESSDVKNESDNALFVSPSPNDRKWIKRAKAAATKDKLVVQIDIVKLQTDVLFQQALGPGLHNQPPHPVVINLLPNIPPITVTTTTVERSAPGYLRWIGYLGDDPQSVVTFVVKEGFDASQRDASLVGTIVVGGRTFRLRPDKNGTHAIIEINTSAFPPEGLPRTRKRPPTFVPYGAEERHSFDPVADLGLRGIVIDRKIALHVEDNGSPLPNCRIDVLVVYTTKAKNAPCTLCASNIYMDISHAVDQANLTYTSSGVRQRLHLVNEPPPASYEIISYKEATTLQGGFAIDLANIITAADPEQNLASTNPAYPLKDANQWRDSHGADLVALWEKGHTKNGLPTECGMSNLMLQESPGVVQSDPNNAYSVVARRCAIGHFSMAHEFGHLGGANHDRGSMGMIGKSPDPEEYYSYGYVLPPKGTPDKHPMSIMAVPAENSCPADADTHGIYCCTSNNCTRGPGFWSNPESTYHDPINSGSPYTGVTTGNTQDTKNRTDDRLILNTSAELLANYRPPTVTPGVCKGGE
jgi:hypothetical protein